MIVRTTPCPVWECRLPVIVGGVLARAYIIHLGMATVMTVFPGILFSFPFFLSKAEPHRWACLGSDFSDNVVNVSL